MVCTKELRIEPALWLWAECETDEHNFLFFFGPHVKIQVKTKKKVGNLKLINYHDQINLIRNTETSKTLRFIFFISYLNKQDI